MRVSESNVADQVLKYIEKKLGVIYFFNHLAVIEFNHGAHIDIESSEEFFDELKQYFGSSRPFGVLANRVNSYSVKLIDIELFRSKAKNVCAYGVVGYDRASKMNAEIENNFCETPNINYDNFYEALEGVYSRVKKQLIKTLD